MKQLLILTAVNNNEDLDILGISKLIRINDLARNNELEDLFTEEVESLVDASMVEWDFNIKYLDMKDIVEVQMGFILGTNIEGEDEIFIAYNVDENIIVVGMCVHSE